MAPGKPKATNSAHASKRKKANRAFFRNSRNSKNRQKPLSTRDSVDANQTWRNLTKQTGKPPTNRTSQQTKTRKVNPSSNSKFSTKPMRFVFLQIAKAPFHRGGCQRERQMTERDQVAVLGGQLGKA
jgi:hypothetical protein